MFWVSSHYVYLMFVDEVQKQVLPAISTGDAQHTTSIFSALF